MQNGIADFVETLLNSYYQRHNGIKKFIWLTSRYSEKLLNYCVYYFSIVPPNLKASSSPLKRHPAPVSSPTEYPLLLQWSPTHLIIPVPMFRVLFSPSQSRGQHCCTCHHSSDIQLQSALTWSLQPNTRCFSSGHRLIYSFLFQCSAFHFHFLNHEDRNTSTVRILLLIGLWLSWMRFSLWTDDGGWHVVNKHIK